jgi:hypothetical protein
MPGSGSMHMCQNAPNHIQFALGWQRSGLSRARNTPQMRRIRKPLVNWADVLQVSIGRGRISRCGDEMMRVMLYEAAQSVAFEGGRPPPATRWINGPGWRAIAGHQLCVHAPRVTSTQLQAHSPPTRRQRGIGCSRPRDRRPSAGSPVRFRRQAVVESRSAIGANPGGVFGPPSA